MMKGLKFWNDRSRYYIQSNNPIEAYHKAIGIKAGWTESCGPTAALTILDSSGYPVAVSVPGVWTPQPEQVLWDYFNDPRNFDKFKQARPNLVPGSIPGNRVPQYYPVAIKEVFGQDCVFAEGKSFQQIADHVSAGKGAQLCLKNPGHYIPVVAFDDTTSELIFHDPFPERFPDGVGFARRLSEADYADNVQPFCVLYSQEQRMKKDLYLRMITDQRGKPSSKRYWAFAFGTISVALIALVALGAIVLTWFDRDVGPNLGALLKYAIGVSVGSCVLCLGITVPEWFAPVAPPAGQGNRKARR